MLCSQALIALSSLAVTARAFRFTIWLGDKCTISGPNEKLSDEQLLVLPQAVDKSGCLKYELMQYGYDQSLMIYPEAGDAADECQFAPVPDLSEMP
ncbi:hypothetical protein Q7P36_002373 [Cladosporium allicinum]